MDSPLGERGALWLELYSAWCYSASLASALSAAILGVSVVSRSALCVSPAFVASLGCGSPWADGVPRGGEQRGKVVAAVGFVEMWAVGCPSTFPQSYGCFFLFAACCCLSVLMASTSASMIKFASRFACSRSKSMTVVSLLSSPIV